MTDSRVSRGRKSEDLLAEDSRVLWPDAEAAAAGLQGTDLRNTPGFAIEVKSRRGFRPLEWARQAARNTPDGEIPLVVVRMTGQGPASIDEWLSFTPWAYMKRLIGEAGYGTAMGARNSSKNPQIDTFGIGGGVAQLHQLGREISEAASQAILRGVDDYVRRQMALRESEGS